MNTQQLENIKQHIPTALPLEQVKKLSTERLLTYFKKHRSVAYKVIEEEGDWYTDEDRTNMSVYVNAITTELGKRENVE
jgi:hypothetical protein